MSLRRYPNFRAWMWCWFGDWARLLESALGIVTFSMFNSPGLSLYCFIQKARHH